MFLWNVSGKQSKGNDSDFPPYTTPHKQALKIGMAADLMSLDAFLGKKELAKGASAVVVISSTYNGTPPDNAAQFMRMCRVSGRGMLGGLLYGMT